MITGNPNQWFNPNAFVLSTPGTWGTLGRGVYNGPGLAEVDLSLFKRIAVIGEDESAIPGGMFQRTKPGQLRHAEPTVFSNGAVSPSAGLITSTVTTSRQIQFGLKLIF